MSETDTGTIVNLMSNDVDRLNKALIIVHNIWLLPIQSIITACLIWQQAQWVGIIGVTCLLLKTVPVQIYLSRHKMLLRKKLAPRTDKRIGIVNEIVQAIQVIKMYAWEIPFQTLVAETRSLEIKQIRLLSYVSSIGFSAQIFVGRSTLFISILVLAVNEQNITPDIVFSLALYFHTLQVRFTKSPKSKSEMNFLS